MSSSNKWDGKFGINYKITDKAMVYADFAQGFRDGGANSGDPQSCYDKGVPQSYVPDTLNNYELGWKTTWLNGHLVWNGAAYLMHWKQLQTIIYDADICAPSSFNVNVGNARIYGLESNVDYKLNENWSMQAAGQLHRFTAGLHAVHDLRRRSGRTAALCALLQLELERCATSIRSTESLRGYAQFDMAHKGDMWNDLHVAGSNGFPRMLQPELHPLPTCAWD